MRSTGSIKRGRYVAVLASIAGILIVSACTSHVAHAPFIKSSLSEQNFDAALARIERINNNTSRLLYLYERGLVLHYQGQYGLSNADFDAAELLYEDLYTKSLTREFGALITSENVLKYRGERHEAAFLHYYKILNYLYLDDPNGALVECRKLNHRLQTFADQDGSFYRNDPFLQYLTGMVYLSRGEYVDANVSLRVALDGFKELNERFNVLAPGALWCDLARSAEALGEMDEARQYHDSTVCTGAAAGHADGGELNLFLEIGYAPYKIENSVIIPLYKDEIREDLDMDAYAETLSLRYGQPRVRERKLAHLLKISVPVLVTNPRPFQGAVIRSEAGGRVLEASATPVENVGALVSEAFEEDKGGILFRTILRALLKYFAKEKTEKKQGVLAGFLVNAINIATESADTRSWTTLPQTVWMVRLELPKGTHDVEVHLIDGRDEGRTITIRDVEITAGRATFLNYRIF